MALAHPPAVRSYEPGVNYFAGTTGNYRVQARGRPIPCSLTHRHSRSFLGALDSSADRRSASGSCRPRAAMHTCCTASMTSWWVANLVVCAWMSVLVGWRGIKLIRNSIAGVRALLRRLWAAQHGAHLHVLHPHCLAAAGTILAPLLQHSPARHWCKRERVQQLKLHLLSLQSGASQGKMVYLFTAPHAWKRANAAALVRVRQHEWHSCMKHDLRWRPKVLLTCAHLSGEGCVPRRSASFRRCS